jgi:hypothetical protein
LLRADNDSQGCERRGRNGPNEHKKELASSPQDDGTVERRGPIGSLHQGLELDAKPSAAQWKRRCEEPEIGARADECPVAHTAATLCCDYTGRFGQAGCVKGKERRRRWSKEWW